VSSQGPPNNSKPTLPSKILALLLITATHMVTAAQQPLPCGILLYFNSTKLFRMAYSRPQTCDITACAVTMRQAVPAVAVAAALGLLLKVCSGHYKAPQPQPHACRLPHTLPAATGRGSLRATGCECACILAGTALLLQVCLENDGTLAWPPPPVHCQPPYASHVPGSHRSAASRSCACLAQRCSHEQHAAGMFLGCACVSCSASCLLYCRCSRSAWLT
jgi:hypothetical protein